MNRRRPNSSCMLVPLLVPLLLFAVSDPVSADYLEVSRPATIKEAPDIDSEIIQRPERGDILALIDVPQENGYYRVHVPDSSDTGYIYRTLVRRYSGTHPDLDSETFFTPSDSLIPSTPGMLEVHVIDVGQGDAIFIRCPDGDHELLIDSGELNQRYPNSGTNFKEYLATHQGQDNPIEVVVASHPHSDHIGNMDWVLEQYDVDLYVDNGNMYHTVIFNSVETAFSESSAEYWSAQDTSLPDIDFCSRIDVSAQILRPDGFGSNHDPNDNSVVVRVDFGGDSFLFVGDTEGHAEELLVQDPATAALLDTDFLKVGHHGSSTSSTDIFLNSVTPMISAISCGARDTGTNRKNKHPRRERVQALLTHAGPRDGASIEVDSFDSSSGIWNEIDLDGAVYVTALSGDLVFESDGNGIRRATNP